MACTQSASPLNNDPDARGVNVLFDKREFQIRMQNNKGRMYIMNG